MSKRNTKHRYTVTRSVYKQIKSYDHSQMEEFLYRVYVNGYDNGKRSIPGVEVDDVLNALKEIKGIGPATMKKVIAVLEDQFGSNGDVEEERKDTAKAG